MTLDDKDGKGILQRACGMGSVTGAMFGNDCQNASALRGLQGPRLLLRVALPSLECHCPLCVPG